MHVNADLHAHSVFAGGAGGGSLDKKLREMRRRFIETQVISQLKGVTFLGTGDVQFEPYMKLLEDNLEEVEDGLYQFKASRDDIIEFEKKRGIDIQIEEEPHYLLQTELIFTSPVGKRRKKAHVLILFPYFEAVKQLNTLMDDWGVSRAKMARPFVKATSTEDISDKISAILDIDSGVEIIPAHVMTPEGVYGGDLRISSLQQFFGDSSERIRIVETGLSADPDILAMIPELDNRVLISNADAHSSALNRLGREFTTIEMGKVSYSSLVDSLRRGKVVKTAEFHPTEGRYFLTGHRENRKKPYIHAKGQFCYYSPRHLPEDGKCPICHKALTIGVLQRAYELSTEQGESRRYGEKSSQPFVTMIPLIEILGFTRGVKTLSSKRLLREYVEIIRVLGNESRIWTDDNALTLLDNASDLVENIREVKRGNFCFSPPGYDGTYGKLVIGETYDFEDVKVENLSFS